jgi:hypothetical protein
MSSAFRRFFRTTLLAAGLLSAGLHAQNDAASRRAAIEGMYPIMLGALEAKNFGRARNICDQAILWEPQNPVHHYNLACIEAQAGGPRLPYAWGALELALALGFDDVEHLKTDPDLFPLHDDPKFADLVRRVTFNLSTGAAIASHKTPETTGKSPATTTEAAEFDQPVAPAFQNELPVGMYFMTRYTPATHSVEKAVWYFAPGGTVFRQLETGFSKADLAGYAGPRGKLTRRENSLAITWSDGGETVSKLERDGSGFAWDMRVFSPVTAFDAASDVVGVYECSESMPPGTGTAVAQRLDLRSDGTFGWDGVALTATEARKAVIKSGNNASTTGRWELSGFSLHLTTSSGITLRRLVFPSDDEKTVVKPDRMFFAGLMFKRRP